MSKPILSEQWKVHYLYQKDDEYWEKRELIYSTEHKDMFEEAYQMWEKDFEKEIKENKVELLKIVYQ